MPFRLEKVIKILFYNRNETFRRYFYIGSMFHFASKYVYMNILSNFQKAFSLLFSVEKLIKEKYTVLNYNKWSKTLFDNRNESFRGDLFFYNPLYGIQKKKIKRGGGGGGSLF